ncbi:MAG: sacsin N-terminal ATP-binding-like domain-containing protein, partial [Nannocystaceae bacterium]
ERYGADPWVFIREFTQNARDAGATRVEIRMEASDQGTSLTFSDDGEGMSWNHAERYLFSLYASSKSDDGRTAGKFGVGFWSLLRIKPSEVIVCSCPRGGEGWRLRIDLGSTTAHRGPYHGPPGTQIHLRIPFPLSIVREAVEDTARQTVRYIRTLRGDAPLDVSVQGVSINAAFNLPSPSRTFALGNIRGVVALGRSPRVELFSRGIRVRAAGCLNDLLRDHPKLSYSRLQFSSLPGGLAPQVLLESDDLELELSRADVKNSKHLALAVRHARRHLERLVVEQLDTLAPPSLRERLREWLGDLPMIGWQRWRRPLSTVALFALSAVVVLNIPREAPDAGSSFRNTTPVATRAPTLPSPATRDESPRPYTDLRARYGGPSSHPEGLAASYHPIDLRYDPPDQPLHLAMLRIDRDPLTIPSFPPPEHPLPRATCEGGCITIALKIDAGVGFLPIPTPTGMGLIPSSLRVQEQKVPGRTLADHASMPMIELAEPTRGILTYSVGPLTRRARPAPLPPAPTLPIELAKAVEEAKTLPHDARVSRLREEVLARVRYDLAPEVAERHRARARLGDDLVTQLLDVGAGDCDLQNGLLTMLLQAAGVPARMAVGYLARDGTPHPFLHAWVEWRDAEGVWRVADASKSDVSANPPTTSHVDQRLDRRRERR